jgi:hypothetical protein
MLYCDRQLHQGLSAGQQVNQVEYNICVHNVCAAALAAPLPSACSSIPLRASFGTRPRALRGRLRSPSLLLPWPGAGAQPWLWVGGMGGERGVQGAAQQLSACHASHCSQAPDHAYTDTRGMKYT